MTAEQERGDPMDEAKRPQDDAMESASPPDEDVGEDNKEAGRHNTGKDSAERPTGTSTARDKTGVDPQDPIVPPEGDPTG